MARIAVVGCGHVGLVMAAGLASLGHDVTGIDVSPSLIVRLQAGIVDIREPGLEQMVNVGIGAGRLRFTTTYAGAIPSAEFIFLAVDTPQTIGGAANLSNLRAAIASVGLNLDGSSPIVVNKSTSPIGTGETIEELLRPVLLSRGREPRIVSNPEFLRQGSAVDDFLHPDRIVVGSRECADALAVVDLYADLKCRTIVVTDLRTAEMVKYTANAFLATRVSFINEIARLCEGVGADIDTVVCGVESDPRIGSAMFTPGIGYGGSCLPKDVAALRYVGDTFGVSTRLLSAVQEINLTVKTAIVRRLRARLGALDGRTLGVWGLTFKGGTEDTRESPAMDVLGLLRNDGAIVRPFDPAVAEDPLRVPPAVAASLASSAIDAATRADALVVLTDWPEFRAQDWGKIAGLMSGRLVVDGRNTLDQCDVEAAGLEYVGVGRRTGR